MAELWRPCMDKPLRKFIITYVNYYDCPVCDSEGDDEDLEDIHSDVINNLEGVLTYVKENINFSKFLKLYEITAFGNIDYKSSFSSTNGFHKIGSVSFTLDGEEQRISYKDGGYHIMTPVEKVLYGKEQP